MWNAGAFVDSADHDASSSVDWYYFHSPPRRVADDVSRELADDRRHLLSFEAFYGHFVANSPRLHAGGDDVTLGHDRQPTGLDAGRCGPLAQLCEVTRSAAQLWLGEKKPDGLLQSSDELGHRFGRAQAGPLIARCPLHEAASVQGEM